MTPDMENIYLYWFAAGVLLIAFEAFAPGAVLIWFGVAALLTGAISFGIDWSLNSQLIFFSVVSLSVTAAFKIWQRKHPAAVALTDSGTALNHPGRELIGRSLVLVTDLKDGSGRVKVADSSWRCTGPDLPTGSVVKVVAIHSGTLEVVAEEVVAEP